jgi:hypothetical protein
VIQSAENALLARARACVGMVLRGKYRLDRLLGVGGMACVYAATHLRNADRVAVKILHRDLSIDAGVRARFLREGAAANRVAHSGTVRVRDDDTAEDGSLFLVMDLLEGETFHARCRRSGRFPLATGPAEPTPVVTRAARVDHRDGAGHLDAAYMTRLREHASHGGRKATDRAFVNATWTSDPSAEEAGEEFVIAVTTCENAGESMLDMVTTEENGGPFLEMSGATEFAYGAEPLKPSGVRRGRF